MGKICEKISPKYHEELRKCNTAADVWQQIKKTQEEDMEANVMILCREEFKILKLDEDGDLMLYLSKMEQLQRYLKDTEAPVGEG
jgi:hypothetical protein